MTFEEYQKSSRRTAIYPNTGKNIIYPVLGLTSEAGEVADKLKKILRDHDGVIDEAKKQELAKELGDVLWYVAQIATEIGLPLEEVAAMNIEKLMSRFERGKLSGSGDNR